MTDDRTTDEHTTDEPRHIVKGNILTPAGWVHGALRFGARIVGIDGRRVDPANNDDVYIVPGFIDVHVHGGAGRDMMEGGDAPHVIAALHAKHGTTSLLATTMTAPVEDIDRALSAIGAACAARGKGEARILGVHLEGPYINAAVRARGTPRRSTALSSHGADEAHHRGA
jgi:N-acetylglucosamine-6-phosphate deacetylase